jgi:hypothetical protein
MAEVKKVLGQAAPAATTPTDLYTVPGATQVVSSSVVVCNRGSVQTTFRISVRVAGAGDATKQYLYYDVAIPGNDTFIATIGMTLGAADVVTVYGGNASLSFNLFGVEIT